MPQRTATTLLELFSRRVAADGDRNALWVKRNGVFLPVTWNKLRRDALRTAAALRVLGVQPKDRVAQLSENRAEWIVTDLAIQLARGIHVPIHAPLAGPQVAEQILDSGARLAIVSTLEQAAKLAAQRHRLPRDLAIFAHERPQGELAAWLHWFPEAVHAAGDAPTSAAGGLDSVEREALDTTRPDDVVTLIYTSGTTGEPKGVMLTHGNLTTNTLATLAVFEMRPDDIRLTLLPLSHIFARTCDLYAWIACGAELALAESRETVLADCAAVRPTLINGVPYFFDRVMRLVREEGREDDPLALAEKLGGRVRIACSGGAALPDHVARFYWDRGVPLVQGYGLTETSPVVTLSTPESNRIGYVGRPIAGVEVRIAEDGEIVTRGPHVMRGYYNKPAATAEVLKDGWFYTGDLGELDPQGYLRITGRKKELIVTAGGKNVAPVQLESLLAEDPLIHQAMIVGEGRNYLTALIVPSGEALRAEIVARRIPVASPAEALAHPAVEELFAKRIGARLAGVSSYEQVRRFTLLDRPFTIDAQELTPTLKLRREVIAAHYAEQIRGMYAS